MVVVRSTRCMPWTRRTHCTCCCWWKMRVSQAYGHGYHARGQQPGAQGLFVGFDGHRWSGNGVSGCERLPGHHHLRGVQPVDVMLLLYTVLCCSVLPSEGACGPRSPSWCAPPWWGAGLTLSRCRRGWVLWGGPPNTDLMAFSSVFVQVWTCWEEMNIQKQIRIFLVM